MAANTHTPPTDAQVYEQQRRVFQVHAGVAAASLTMIFVVNLVINLGTGLTGDWWAWWSGWALIGWGLGIGVHGLVVRLARPEGVETA